MIKKLFSHTVIYGLAGQISLVVNFLMLPFITPNLSAIDFGVSGIITSYTSAISILAVLGLRVVLVNSFFKSPNHYKWGWRQIYGFLTLWNIPYAIILSIVIYFATPQEAAHNLWIIILLNVSPLVLFGQTSLLGLTYYQMSAKPMQIALRSIIFGIMTACLDLLFIKYMHMGYMGWFWSIFITTILRNASYWVPLRKMGFKPIFNFKKRYIRNSLKVGLPAIPHFYSGYLLNSSNQLIMHQLSVPTQDIGRYNAANTFGKLMDGMSTATGWAIGPILNARFKVKDDTSAKYLIFILQIFFFCVTFILCVWLKELFKLMIRNEDLQLTYPLGIILIMAQNYRPMYFGSNTKLMFEEKTGIIWKVTLVAGIINVLLNFILIPIWGFGAAVVSSFVAFTYMGYAGYFYPVFKKINKERYRPILWMLASFALCAAAYFIVELDMCIKIVISAIAIVSAFLFIVIFNKKMNKKIQHG